MGNAATQAKQRYNEGHYTQVKVYVSPDVAIAFKRACATSNVSMSGKLSQFMSEYSNNDFYQKSLSNTAISHKPSIDYSTKRRRRTAILSLIQQLEQIKDAEESCRDNIPVNLQSSVVFENADQCVSLLEEAIDLLVSIY